MNSRVEQPVEKEGLPLGAEYRKSREKWFAAMCLSRMALSCRNLF